MTPARILVASLALLAAAAPSRPQPRAARAGPEVMYATSWCPYCAKARAPR